MAETTSRVEGLQKKLEVKMVDVEREKIKTDELIEIVGRESVDAEKEQGEAMIVEENTIEATNAAEKEKAEANLELAEAKPAMEAA
jgi:ribosomal protein L15E